MGLTFGSSFKRPFEELQLLGHFSALPLFLAQWIHLVFFSLPPKELSAVATHQKAINIFWLHF